MDVRGEVTFFKYFWYFCLCTFFQKHKRIVAKGIDWKSVTISKRMTFGSQCVATHEKVPMRIKPEWSPFNSDTCICSFKYSLQTFWAYGSSFRPSEVSLTPPLPRSNKESILGTKIGAATVFSVLLDTADRVKLVFDKEAANGEYYGCSDGTTTGYMKIKTELIMKKFLQHPAWNGHYTCCKCERLC